MELSERKIEELKKQPIIENQFWQSKDGEWIIHETRIVDIKPINYVKKVVGA